MQKNPLYNTSSISFFQYLFAIAVILVHSGRLTSYEPLHFGLKSMLGRLAVPFFIVCASFFLKQSLGNSQKMKAYLVKIVKTYLFWSFVYLPYAWVFFSSLHLSHLSFSGWCVRSSGLLGNVLPTLVYPGLFAGFVFSQSIGQTPRNGLDGVDHLPSLLLGLDRDLFGLSGHHKSSQRLPALQQFIFYSAKWSLLHAHFYLYGLLSV